MRLLFDVVDAMESASEPRLGFDFGFAIIRRIVRVSRLDLGNCRARDEN